MTPSPIDPPAPLKLDLDELSARVGQALGHSAWHTVTQDRVDRFADATGDRQWIHVDPRRAKEGPFGVTIAHGYLTLSLVPRVLNDVLVVEQAGLVVNYGLDKVRFPAPVPVGSRIRAAVELLAVEEVTGGVQASFRLTFEVEGAPKPPCVAEILFRYYRPEPADPAES